MEIYIGNIHKNVTKEELKEKFGKYGQVATVKLKKDLFTGENKGYAFVAMPIQAEAKAAVKALNGKKLRGREIKVTEARSHDYDWNKGKNKGKLF
jgi:RNA recognition motif-containing protein